MPSLAMFEPNHTSDIQGGVIGTIASAEGTSDSILASLGGLGGYARPADTILGEEISNEGDAPLFVNAVEDDAAAVEQAPRSLAVHTLPEGNDATSIPKTPSRIGAPRIPPGGGTPSALGRSPSEDTYSKRQSASSAIKGTLYMLCHDLLPSPPSLY